MVTNVTSLTQSGLRDWLVQRTTAVILAVYALFLLIYMISNQPINYFTWHALFNQVTMKVFSTLALISLLLHSWVGVWTIFTDYVKPAQLRLALLVLMIIALFAYFFWGLAILWGF